MCSKVISLSTKLTDQSELVITLTKNESNPKDYFKPYKMYESIENLKNYFVCPIGKVSEQELPKIRSTLCTLFGLQYGINFLAYLVSDKESFKPVEFQYTPLYHLQVLLKKLNMNYNVCFYVDNINGGIPEVKVEDIQKVTQKIIQVLGNSLESDNLEFNEWGIHIKSDLKRKKDLECDIDLKDLKLYNLTGFNVEVSDIEELEKIQIQK